MAAQQDKNKKSGEAEDNKESFMLQVWLNEPKDIISATDAWSSERAIIQPRCNTIDATSRSSKNKCGGAAKAAEG